MMNPYDYAPARVVPLIRANDNPDDSRDMTNELLAKRASYEEIARHLDAAISAARCGMVRTDEDAKVIAEHLLTYKSQALMKVDELTRRIAIREGGAA